MTFLYFQPITKCAIIENKWRKSYGKQTDKRIHRNNRKKV